MVVPQPSRIGTGTFPPIDPPTLVTQMATLAAPLSYSSTRQPTGVARSSTWVPSSAPPVTPRPWRRETTAWSKVFWRRALASGAARASIAARRLVVSRMRSLDRTLV